MAVVSEQLPNGSGVFGYAIRPDVWSIGSTIGLESWFREDRIDVVHAACRGPLAVAAVVAAARCSLPLLGSFPVDPGDSAIDRICLRVLARMCRSLLVPSASARDEIVNRQIPVSRIVSWRPGVDCGMFSVAKRSAALREHWEVSESRPAVVFAGTLSPGRGAQRLLSLELALHRSHPMHRLIVIGDGPSRDDLQARCSHAVFTGQLSRSAYAEALASADLFVSPSECTSTSLAVLEAQASGLPVVAMERGSARERVSDASAIVCRSQSDFIVNTAALIRTDTRRRAMGHEARQHAMRQQWETGLAPMLAEYRRAAEAPHAHHWLRSWYGLHVNAASGPRSDRK